MIIETEFAGNCNKKFYQDTIYKQFLPIDSEISILIINDSLEHKGDFDKLNLEEIQDMLDVNLYQTGLLSKVMLPSF